MIEFTGQPISIWIVFSHNAKQLCYLVYLTQDVYSMCSLMQIRIPDGSSLSTYFHGHTSAKINWVSVPPIASFVVWRACAIIMIWLFLQYPWVWVILWVLSCKHRTLWFMLRDTVSFISWISMRLVSINMPMSIWLKVSLIKKNTRESQLHEYIGWTVILFW